MLLSKNRYGCPVGLQNITIPAPAEDIIELLPTDSAVDVPAARIKYQVSLGGDWILTEYYGAPVNKKHYIYVSGSRMKRDPMQPTVGMSAITGIIAGPSADLTTITSLRGYNIVKLNNGACFSELKLHAPDFVRRFRASHVVPQDHRMWVMVDLQQRGLGRAFTPRQQERLEWLLPIADGGYWNPYLRCLFFDVDTVPLWKIFFICSLLRYVYEASYVADMAIAIKNYYPTLSKLQAMYLGHFPQSYLHRESLTLDEQEELQLSYVFNLNWNHTIFDSSHKGYSILQKRKDGDNAVRQELDRLDEAGTPFAQDKGDNALGVAGFTSSVSMLKEAMYRAEQLGGKFVPDQQPILEESAEVWKQKTKKIMAAYTLVNMENDDVYSQEDSA